jgi:hypothetical protein
MEENPYSPPLSELDEPSAPTGDGPLIPWEDHNNYPQLWDRIVQTLRILLRPSEAGKALGGARKIMPSASFMALVGLPLPWLFQLFMLLRGPINPMQEILPLFGMPAPPPPDPSMQAVQRIMQLVQVILLPVFIAFGFGVWGLLVHGGLWLTRTLQPGRGIETTFRTLLYSSALMFLVSWIFNLWMFLPPIAALVVLSLSVLGWIAFQVYQGVLLAKAHEAQLWRGILGIFAPWLILCCCCGGFGALVGGMAALAARR